MAYLDLKGEGDNSMPGKQRPCPCVGAGRCGTRAIWLKLNCLNPNLQQAQSRLPPERRMKPAPALLPVVQWPGAPPGLGAMPSEGIEGDEWGA
jgi:hypothetical protein